MNTFRIDSSWQESAASALTDLWYGGKIISTAPYSWIENVESNLPSLNEVNKVLSDKDLRTLFQHMGFITIVNSNLKFGEVLDTVIGKQRDYGHGNILKFGLTGIVVRLSDKIERLKNLSKTGVAPTNESVRDTQLDIVGYCMIALMLLDNTFTRELADTAVAA